MGKSNLHCDMYQLTIRSSWLCAVCSYFTYYKETI